METLSALTVSPLSDDEWDNLPKTPDIYIGKKSTMTLTEKIFELSAPYDNPYQSDRPRWLFVCSAGLLRSPTGAAVATELGANARSCGSSNYALIPLSVNLIMWAQCIFFVNKENYMDAKITFENTGYEEDIEEKCVILDIPDIYRAYDPVLVTMWQTELKNYL